MTKIDIISGFLGAGKTTLIKKLLAGALKGEQVVLIENEFGEIGIDGGFLQEAGIEIREMNSGCICCSLVGDFGKALEEVIEKYHPQRIIIEPSGVGKLSDVIKAVQDLELSDIQLNSFTTVCDVNKAKMYKDNFGEFFENQLQFARTIVLSRTDTPKATDEKVASVVAMIREINPDAAIITTPVENLDSEQVMNTMEKGRAIDDAFMAEVVEEVAKHHHHHHHHHDEDGHCCHHDHEEHEDHDEDHCCHHDHDEDEHEHDHEGHCCHHDHDEDEHEHHHEGHCCHHDHDEDEHEHEHEHEHRHEHHYDENGVCSCGHHHDHDADEVFESWGTDTARKYDKAEIENILKALSGDEYGIILRAKGMVAGKDGEWIYFDMVPEECDVRSGAAQPNGKFCVIGSKLDTDKLKELFK